MVTIGFGKRTNRFIALKIEQDPIQAKTLELGDMIISRWAVNMIVWSDKTI
jgi:hypothetical protein